MTGTKKNLTCTEAFSLLVLLAAVFFLYALAFVGPIDHAARTSSSLCRYKVACVAVDGLGGITAHLGLDFAVGPLKWPAIPFPARDLGRELGESSQRPGGRLGRPPVGHGAHTGPTPSHFSTKGTRRIFRETKGPFSGSATSFPLWLRPAKAAYVRVGTKSGVWCPERANGDRSDTGSGRSAQAVLIWGWAAALTSLPRFHENKRPVT